MQGLDESFGLGSWIRLQTGTKMCGRGWYTAEQIPSVEVVTL